MDAKQVWEEANSLLMPQYGTSMHYPYCNQSSCTGCLPPVRFEPEKLDLAIFESPIATRPQDWAASAREILRSRGTWRA
jgi:hypothetical protein